MTSLQDFISEVKNGGLAKSNRFMVTFTPPKTLSASTSDLKRVLMFCESSQLPGLSIASNQTRTFGEIRESPYDRIFDNVNLTFYVDTAMTVKKFFDDWIMSIQGSATRDFEFYDDYVTDIQIAMIDGFKNGEETTPYIVTLKECYPKSVAAVNIAYGDNNLMTVNVTMNIKHWTSEIMYPTDAENKIKTKSFLSGSFTSMLRDFTGTQGLFNEAQGIFTGLGSSKILGLDNFNPLPSASRAISSVINSKVPT